MRRGWGGFQDKTFKSPNAGTKAGGTRRLEETDFLVNLISNCPPLSQALCHQH
jgi:hypothetical protein